MFIDLRNDIRNLVTDCLQALEGAADVPVEIDMPTDSQHGEFSCNVALRLARPLKKSPLMIAQDLQQRIQRELHTRPLQDRIDRVEVKNPGFINFYLSRTAFCEVLGDVFAQAEAYGRSDYGRKAPWQVEFVSANPTGPLSVAHARQAAVGDALVRILNFAGYEAKSEYYVNDGGNQINMLGASIRCRALESLGEDVTFPEDGYQGEYIKDMAAEFMRQQNVKTVADVKALEDRAWSKYGADTLLDLIKTDLKDFGVTFDAWSHESAIATRPEIEALLKDWQAKGLVYEKDGALWFESTRFGDDKDRVLRKSDGSFTYLTPDIVYHKNKFDRGFVKIINIWGPDHHGYVPRIKAAAQAMDKNADAIDVLIVQLATIFRNGQPVSMSTRRGEFISMREVMDEVGTDAARFFFMMRQISQHLEFDLELAKKQTAENPVFYIQYAHARIHSIIRKAADEAQLQPKRSGWNLLALPEEITLLKTIGFFPDYVILCARQQEPFGMIRYLQELATAFHKFYDKCRVLDEENKDVSSERLALIDAVRLVLANGLRLLGVSAPEQM